ncbi:MAG: hypothetical protein M3Z66_20510 [Chloroflexota bacterium]|nr:hypothetical protein [Chloroflexota bacterium]
MDGCAWTPPRDQGCNPSPRYPPLPIVRPGRSRFPLCTYHARTTTSPEETVPLRGTGPGQHLIACRRGTDRLTFWTRHLANTSPRHVDRWGGIYRLLPDSRIAFRTATAHWVAHYSIFDPDLETDVSGQRSVWQRTH